MPTHSTSAATSTSINENPSPRAWLDVMPSEGASRDPLEALSAVAM
jgi:hypothetical protein